MPINICKQAQAEIPSYGIYITLADPSLIEMAAHTGYDFARIDCEHVLFDHRILAEMFRTARLLDFPLQIRISSTNNLSSLLALEPSGVMLSHLDNVGEAADFVRQMRFAPLGERGMYGMTKHVRYGQLSRSQYMSYANENIQTIVQIESNNALGCLEEIIQMPGIDMISTGKADLSQSLGVAGQTSHPLVIEAENRVIETTLYYGKTPVIMADSPERITSLRKQGVFCYLVGFDESLCYQAFAEKLNKVKIH